MIHVPKSAAPTYPITRPVSATDRPNDPLFDWLPFASALCPQIIAGTEVIPRVNKEKTPNTKAQSGRVGRSSFAESKAAAVVEDEESIITDL